MANISEVFDIFFMIPKQFDIYNNHESVRVLMVSSGTAYLYAVSMNRDLILIPMLACAFTIQMCKVPVLSMSVTLCLWLADRTGRRFKCTG